MNNFIVSNHFREIAKFLPIDFEVEGVPFELMPLTDDLIAKLKDGHKSQEAVLLAADWALSYDNNRVIDNHKMVKSISDLWQNEKLPKVNPTIRQSVGEKVIEISGLDDYILDLRVKEDEEIELDEDGNPVINEGTDLNKTMGEIQQAANNAAR